MINTAAAPVSRLEEAGTATAWIVGMPRNILRYVLATSAPHQLFLVPLTVGVSLLAVVPLELQRRIINDLVKHRAYRSIIALAAVYGGTVLLQGGIKLVLNVYRSWGGERAKRDLRRRVHVLVARLPPLHPLWRRKAFRPR